MSRVFKELAPSLLNKSTCYLSQTTTIDHSKNNITSWHNCHASSHIQERNWYYRMFMRRLYVLNTKSRVCSDHPHPVTHRAPPPTPPPPSIWMIPLGISIQYLWQPATFVRLFHNIWTAVCCWLYLAQAWWRYAITSCSFRLTQVKAPTKNTQRQFKKRWHESMWAHYHSGNVVSNEDWSFRCQAAFSNCKKVACTFILRSVSVITLMCLCFLQ